LSKGQGFLFHARAAYSCLPALWNGAGVLLPLLDEVEFNFTKKYLTWRGYHAILKQSMVSMLSKTKPQASCASGEFMNNNLKYGLFFLGGVALGAIGAVAVSRGKLDLKPLATDLISRGLEMKDAVLAKADAVREDVEDMVAEARAVSEQRKAQPEESC
jgi:hypothetical protein